MLASNDTAVRRCASLQPDMTPVSIPTWVQSRWPDAGLWVARCRCPGERIRCLLFLPVTSMSSSSSPFPTLFSLLAIFHRCTLQRYQTDRELFLCLSNGGRQTLRVSPRLFHIRFSTPPNLGILLQSLLPLADCDLNVESITNTSTSLSHHLFSSHSPTFFISRLRFRDYLRASLLLSSRKLDSRCNSDSFASSLIMLVFSLAMAAFAVVTTFATPLKPLQHKKIEAGIKDRSLPHLTGRDVNDAALAQLPTVSVPALIHSSGLAANNIQSVVVMLSINSSPTQTTVRLLVPSAAFTLPLPAWFEPPSLLPTQLLSIPWQLVQSQPSLLLRECCDSVVDQSVAELSWQE